MFLTKSRDQQKISQLSKESLQQRLYIPGRLGKSLLSEPACIQILTGLYDDKIVGWCMVFYNPALIADEYFHLGIYINELYRGQRFGEILINKTVERIPYPIKVDDESIDYYKRIPNLNEVLIGNSPKLSFSKRYNLFQKLPLTEEINLVK